MRLRLGILIGFTIGYVLGSKAGRQRYEQIVAAVRRVKPSDTFDPLPGATTSGNGASVTGTGTYSSSR